MSEEPDHIDVFVGERLRAFRKLRRTSLDELGRRTGVTYQQVQKYERGVNRISASQLWRLSKALDIDVGVFFPNRSDDTNADTVYWAAAIGKLAPEIQLAIVTLIDAIAAAHE